MRPRESEADEIGQRMGAHAGWEIAVSKIEDGEQHSAECHHHDLRQAPADLRGDEGGERHLVLTTTTK
jgi:hypothetical protein